MHEPADTLTDVADDVRNLFDLSGRVAVVTGGTRGLGLAMARGFAHAGAEVVIVSRKHEACEEVAAALRAEGAKAAACACHVGHWDRLDGLVEGVYRDFGRVDVLVNNAGLSPLYGELTEVTEELFDKVIGVNLKGPFRLAALVGERMLAAGGGSIINVSSHRRGAADEGHRALRRREGRRERDDRRPGARAGTDRARERDHAGPLPHLDRRGMGHGPLRAARADVPAAPGGRGARRSSARRSTSPATRRATPPARSSPSTAGRNGAWREPVTTAQLEFSSIAR